MACRLRHGDGGTQTVDARFVVGCDGAHSAVRDLAVVGIVVLFSGSIIWGIVLLIVAALIGPGGYGIFQRRSA